MTSNRIVDLVESDGVDLSRRRFLSVSAAVGGGLLIGFTTRPAIEAAEAAQSVASPPFTPNAFVRIGSDGHVERVPGTPERGCGIEIDRRLPHTRLVSNVRSRPADVTLQPRESFGWGEAT